MALKPVEILITARDNAKSVIDKLRQSATGLAKSLRGVKPAAKQAEDAQDQLKNSTNTLSNSFKTAALRIGAVVGAAIGLNAIKRGFLEIINTGARFEILNKQLAAVMGTVEGGEAAFAWIEDFAKNTPLQLEDVTKSFVRMKAFGLDPMDGTMQKLVDANAKLGGSQETLNGIILAVGQAWTKQKLQAEEANQLIERGIPVWELLAKSMGKTTAEVIELSTQGEIGQKQIAGLINAIGDSATGAAADQMKTLTGLTSNLSDTWTRFLDSIAQSGVLDAVKAQLNEIANTVERMASDGSLKRLAQDISDGFITAGSAIKSTVGFISEFSGQLVILGKVLVTAKLVQFAGGLRNIGLAATSATLSTQKLRAAIAGLSKAAGLTALSAAIFDVVDKLILAKKAANDLKKAQSELDESTTQRIGSLRAEAEALELNISKQGENITAIVDAILARKEEIAALEAAAAANRDYAAEVEQAALRGQEVSEGVLKLASAAGVSADEIDRLSQSSRTIINDFSQFESQAGGVKKALDGLELSRIVEMQTDLNKAFEAGLVGLETFQRISRELGENELSRLGVSLEQIKGEITQFGIEAVGAFTRLAESASLTKKQLTDVAVKLASAAETKADIEALNVAFTAAGVATGKFSKAGKALQNQLNNVAQSATDAGNAVANLGSQYIASAAAQVEAENNAHAARQRGILQAHQQQQQQAQASQQQARTSQEAATQADALAAIIGGLKNRVAEYGDAWVDVLNKQRAGFTSEGGAFFFQRLGKQFRDTINIARQFNEEIQNNAQSLQFMAEGGAASSVQLEIMRDLLQESLKDADKLSKASLDQLKNSIAAANDELGRMSNLAQIAADKLGSLQDEWDRLNDNQAAIDQRRLQQQRLEIETQLQAARDQGNEQAINDLQQSLSLLTQINQKKQQNNALDAASSATQAVSNSAATPIPAPAPTQPAATSRTVNLQFVIGNTNQTINAAFDSQNDADHFLEILKQMGTVS